MFLWEHQVTWIYGMCEKKTPCALPVYMGRPHLSNSVYIEYSAWVRPESRVYVIIAVITH